MKRIKGIGITLIVFFILSCTAACALETHSLEDLKKAYFQQYPASKGYVPLGEAFENSFISPKWWIQQNGEDGTSTPFFGGQMYVDDRKIAVDVSFRFLSNGYAIIEDIYVDNRWVYSYLSKTNVQFVKAMGCSNEVSDSEFLSLMYSLEENRR